MRTMVRGHRGSARDPLRPSASPARPRAAASPRARWRRPASSASGPLLRRKTTAIHSVSHYVARCSTATCKSPGVPSVVIPNFHVDETDGAGRRGDPRAPAEASPSSSSSGPSGGSRGSTSWSPPTSSLDDPPPLVMVGIKTPDTPRELPGRRHGADRRPARDGDGDVGSGAVRRLPEQVAGAARDRRPRGDEQRAAR